jgi:phospholipid/cholesterol/gamma-HCH transport system substrate-binding protein
MLRRQLERYGKWLLAILLLVVVAIASGVFIFTQERLRTPLANRYVLNAEFASSESLTPGLGQPVNVAGVRVGDIVDAKLVDGRARVKLSIDPDELPHVYGDASAVLRPNTPLKDMQVELAPGRPPAPVLRDGGLIPLGQTNVPADSDELTGVLDADTRQYFTILVATAERGLRGRGGDLRRALRALGPTTGQLRRIARLLAARRGQIRRVVHNTSVLSRAAAGKDRELRQVISASDATVSALGSQDAALRESVARLPGTLGQARTTLGHTRQLATVLGPTLTALQPSADRLPGALRSTNALLGQAVPLMKQTVPALRATRPLVRDITAVTRDFNAMRPDITGAFQVLDYVANELTYNPPGDDEGYLFWLAWAMHNLNSVVSTEDAHGSVVRGLALVSCSSLNGQPGLAPLVQLIITNLPNC